MCKVSNFLFNTNKTVTHIISIKTLKHTFIRLKVRNFAAYIKFLAKMNTNISYINWHTIDYKTALDKQTELFNGKVQMKLDGKKDIEQDFIVCQHNNVYTLGLHGKDSNMLVSEAFLKKIDAQVFHTNRGGDITYHGHGQITGYPILNIDEWNMGIRDYIDLIEQMVIDVMAQYNISCQRVAGATGVWLDVGTKKERKICAIGVKCSRGITMHGFALNVNTDLKYFSYINPCGFTDKGVTSMQQELNTELDLSEVAEKLYNRFVYLINNYKK